MLLYHIFACGINKDSSYLWIMQLTMQAGQEARAKKLGNYKEKIRN